MLRPLAQPERYAILRALGRGSMGTVFLAEDTVLQRLVALKRSDRAGAADLLRFKREFRAIEQLAHPNLVRLYELGSDARGLYFTMEPISGTDLASWCAAGDRFVRLEEALPQIARGLAHLHDHGVVHCDLKPSNILVTDEGKVVIVDFGVLAALGHGSSSEGIGGTPAYLAPERARGEAVRPATDVYALGCTLFEIAAGRPPFSGTTAAVLAAHRDREPPDLKELSPECPEHLARLCASMLAKDPRDRPSLEQLARDLSTPSSHPAARSGPSELIGRELLTARLSAIWSGPDAPRLTALIGPSGVGKSRLLEWAASHERAQGRALLRGASRATERIAFNALDAAMDDLARALPQDRALASARRVAAEAFPVLRDAASAIDAAREAARKALFGWSDRPEDRTRAEVFEAVTELVDAVANGSRAPGAPSCEGLTVICDDLQWADADSIALLRHLVERARSDVRVVVAMRDDESAERSLAQAWLREERALLRIEVPPLAEGATRALVRSVAAARGAAVDDAAIETAAAACAGRPYLAEIAGRALARGGAATLELLLQPVWERSGELLGLLAVHDSWVSIREIAALLGASLGELDQQLNDLAEQGLVRRSGAADQGMADLYHDRVRAAVNARLSESERSSLHRRIAQRLLAQRDAPSVQLAIHLLRGGQPALAAAHARRAAALAERQRAFGLAADLYEIVLAAHPHDRELLQARAVALVNGGRYSQAADAWGEVASRASLEHRSEALLHRAHALIAAGRAGDGILTLDQVLRVDGGEVRVNGLRAILTAGRFVFHPFVAPRPSIRRRASAGSPQQHRSLKLGTLLAFHDPLTGLGFLQRAREQLAAEGDVAQVAGCDYLLAVLALAGSRDPEWVPLADAYQARADRLAASAPMPPDVLGMPAFIEGLRAMRRGKWAEAHAAFDRGAEIFRGASGTTEYTMCRSWRMMMSAHQQDLSEMRRHVDWFDRHTASCGATILVAHHALVDGYALLLEGRFREAFDLMTRASDIFTGDPPSAQRAALRIYRWTASYYDADAREVHREVRAAFDEARPFHFLRTMYGGIYACVAALAEANALRAGDPDASERRVEALARIADGAPRITPGAQHRARAYAADARGHRERAMLHLEAAEEEAARYGRVVDAAIARWQRGRRLGGDEGSDLCESAQRAVALGGVSPKLLEEDVGSR